MEGSIKLGINRKSNVLHPSQWRADGSLVSYNRNELISRIQYPSGQTVEFTYDGQNRVKSYKDGTGQFHRGELLFGCGTTPIHAWIPEVPNRIGWRGSIKVDQNTGTWSWINFDTQSRVDVRTSGKRVEAGRIGCAEQMNFYFLQFDGKEPSIILSGPWTKHELEWRGAQLISVTRTKNDITTKFVLLPNGIWSNSSGSERYVSIRLLASRSIQYDSEKGERTIYKLDGRVIRIARHSAQRTVDSLINEIVDAVNVYDRKVLEIINGRDCEGMQMIEDLFDADPRAKGRSLRSTLRGRMLESGWQKAERLLVTRGADRSWETARLLADLLNACLAAGHEQAKRFCEEQIIEVFSGLTLALRQSVGNFYRSPFGPGRELWDDLFGSDSVLRNNLAKRLLQSLWLGSDHQNTVELFVLADIALAHRDRTIFLYIMQILSGPERLQYLARTDECGLTGEQRLRSRFGTTLRAMSRAKRTGLSLRQDAIDELVKLMFSFNEKDFLANMKVANDRRHNRYKADEGVNMFANSRRKFESPPATYS